MILALLLTVALVVVLVSAFRSPGAWSRRTTGDFAMGFLGWFLINALLWAWVKWEAARMSGTLFINPIGILPLLVNIVAMLILFGFRRWMTLGIFSAIMVNGLGSFLFLSAEERPIHIIGMIPFFMQYLIPALF